MDIKVGLVEDKSFLAGELEKWINGAKGLKCVGVFPSAEIALQTLPNVQTDVMVVDLRLPGMSGVEFIRKLKVLLPHVQCLVLTMYSESNMIFEALQAGACGYLLKRTKPADIVDAIRQVYAGGSVMTPRIARRVLEMLSKTNPANIQSDDHRLNEREKDVLKAMVEGLARKQISEKLAINAHTLDYVIRCIYKKLHVNCIAAAVSIAVRDRLTQP
jgi:DNA-binding NarL/FixJ family response regulator